MDSLWPCVTSLMYVQGPLMIARKGGTERNLNEIMAGSQSRTLAVEGRKQSHTSAL